MKIKRIVLAAVAALGAQRAHAAITEVQSPHAVPAASPRAVVDVIHQATTS